jgi:FtsH-binding integral membrane protein
LIAFGIFQALFAPHVPALTAAYSLVGAILFCLFIIYDTWKVCKVSFAIESHTARISASHCACGL